MRVHVPVFERRLINSSHVNLLLEGDPAAIDAVLADLRSSFRGPVTTWRPGETLVLPCANEPGTLVLRDVSRLRPVDQLQLLEWMASNDGVVQMVAATSERLFPLVVMGAFLDALYYRLNVVYLDLSAQSRYPWVANGAPGKTSISPARRPPRNT